MSFINEQEILEIKIKKMNEIQNEVKDKIRPACQLLVDYIKSLLPTEDYDDDIPIGNKQDDCNYFYSCGGLRAEDPNDDCTEFLCTLQTISITVRRGNYEIIFITVNKDGNINSICLTDPYNKTPSSFNGDILKYLKEKIDKKTDIYSKINRLLK